MVTAGLSCYLLRAVDGSVAHSVDRDRKVADAE